MANFGQLRGAFVVLAAPQVNNAGSIVTSAGTTVLAAGGRVTLDIAGDRLVSMSVDAATADAAVRNSGSIEADGGRVFMSASSANAVLDTVINTSGIVRAASMVERNGQIVIDGGGAGVVQVSGTLAASGGAAGATGGTVKVLGEKVALLAGAQINVSGDAGGGSALLGGDLHGAGGVPTAAYTEVAQGALIHADALTRGNGGTVVVWADQHTDFAGSISAKGGAGGGDGGLVETSGKHTLAFSGSVTTSAVKGATGTLLLDPTDITISTSAGTASGGVSVVNVGVLTSALGSNNVVLDSASGEASLGNITVATGVSYASGNSLTLKAQGGISVNAAIQNTGGGAVRLYGDGAIRAGSVSTLGGAVEIKGYAGGASKAGALTGGAIVSAGGNVLAQARGPVSTGSINAGAGTIAVSSDANLLVNGALVSANTGVSAIVLQAGATALAGAGAGGDISVTGSLATGAGGRATLYTAPLPAATV